MLGDVSDDETGGGGTWGGVAGRVLLLDVSERAWSPPDSPPAASALQAALLLLRRVLAAGEAHVLGVALFGTRLNDDKGLENVVQLFEVQRPTVDQVMLLKQHCSDVQSVKDTWGSVNNYNLSDALWQASKMFSYCKTKMNRQTVSILSCFTEPDPANHRSILKKASDLFALGIEVNFVNISEDIIPDDSFYSQLERVFVDETYDDSEDWAPPEPTITPDEILDKIWQSTHKKSASAKLKMFLSPDVNFGVGLYYLCKERNLPKKITLHRETNERVETKSNTFKAEDVEEKPILRAELCMCQRYGDRNIEITYGEYMQLKKFGGDPRIQLLGFKPSSILTMAQRYLKPCAFLYPDEFAVSGSTKLFRCLRDRCEAKGRVAICLMVSRWYSHPRLVALVPQNQKMDKGNQIQPDGFHVIYLPYRDNMKDVNVEEGVEVSEAQMLCMKKIINKLKFEYTMETFENPKLRMLYDAIEALALDDGEPQNCEDDTIPDLEMQGDRLGSLPEDFEALFGTFGVSPTKRKNTNDGNSSSKKATTESMDAPDIEILAGRIGQSLVDKYTVPQLKQILKWRNPSDLPALTGLKKTELVNLVYQYCSEI